MTIARPGGGDDKGVGEGLVHSGRTVLRLRGNSRRKRTGRITAGRRPAENITESASHTREREKAFMGNADDAKETAKAGVTKATRAAEDIVDRTKDKVSEVEAEAKVKVAEAEQSVVEHRNDAKAKLRGN